jgi:transcriptional regulator with XRE-family HTH domain
MPKGLFIYGCNLTRERKRRLLSQEELAVGCRCTGSNIRRIEQVMDRTVGVGLAFLRRLAEFWAVPFDEIKDFLTAAPESPRHPRPLSTSDKFCIYSPGFYATPAFSLPAPATTTATLSDRRCAFSCVGSVVVAEWRCRIDGRLAA